MSVIVCALVALMMTAFSSVIIAADAIKVPWLKPMNFNRDDPVYKEMLVDVGTMIGPGKIFQSENVFFSLLNILEGEINPKVSLELFQPFDPSHENFRMQRSALEISASYGSVTGDFWAYDMYVSLFGPDVERQFAIYMISQDNYSENLKLTIFEKILFRLYLETTTKASGAGVNGSITKTMKAIEPYSKIKEHKRIAFLLRHFREQVSIEISP